MKEEKKDDTCCGRSVNKDLGQKFWDDQYISNTIGWDMGEVSPPLKEYIDQLKDKNLRILIPGCGNTYEAEYLLKSGFTNVTVIDISPTLVEKLRNKFKNNPSIKILLEDFFDHKGEYDLILEQTFFCALHPSQRSAYRDKMHTLLAPQGKLAGVLFDREFEAEGPPFGGSKESYKKLFNGKFEILKFEKCRNSFHKRKDTELFILLKRKMR
jgi:SAM-dependent methyltransferase